MKEETNKPSRVIYIIGSLKNPSIPIIANKLRKDMGKDVEIFDDWYFPGDDADDWLYKCCKDRGLNYKQTLKTWGAKHIFEFDKTHIERATDVVMIMPAGKSAHLELGYSVGRGKRGYILFNEMPERADIMHQFATEIFFDYDELVAELKKY
jgi:hypothetical protein